jgi:hypothetical protein
MAEAGFYENYSATVEFPSEMGMEERTFEDADLQAVTAQVLACVDEHGWNAELVTAWPPDFAAGLHLAVRAAQSQRVESY